MEKLKIALIGDVMCGDSFHSLGRGVASSLKKYGKSFLDPQIVQLFHQHDLVLFNMESVLSDVGRREYSLRKLHMRGRPEAAAYLANWGLTCANVANNHILEQGLDCAIDTVQHLLQAGIQVVGAGNEGLFEPGIQTVTLNLKGQMLSILGLCLLDEKYAYSGGLNFDQVLDSVKALSQSGQTVIVALHWGKELMDRPTSQQKQMAQDLINAGASIIAGHHPHVMQGVELRNEGLIAYSLGNFIFDGFLEDNCWSTILTVELTDKQVTRWSFVPVMKDKEHRPRLAEGSNKKRLDIELKRRCELLALQQDSDAEQQRYMTEFIKTDTNARQDLWLRLFKTLFQKKWYFWPQLFLRPIQRRLGRW